MADKVERALNARQAAFAGHLVETKGNAAEAARLAGYSDQSAKVMGPALKRDPRIKAILRAMTLEILADSAPEAALSLRGLLTSRSHAVRLGAAKDILDRNRVGVTNDVGNQQALVVNISLGETATRRVIEG